MREEECFNMCQWSTSDSGNLLDMIFIFSHFIFCYCLHVIRYPLEVYMICTTYKKWNVLPIQIGSTY